jgi:hypothetical protein
MPKQCSRKFYMKLTSIRFHAHNRNWFCLPSHNHCNTLTPFLNNPISNSAHAFSRTVILFFGGGGGGVGVLVVMVMVMVAVVVTILL